MSSQEAIRFDNFLKLYDKARCDSLESAPSPPSATARS